MKKQLLEYAAVMTVSMRGNKKGATGSLSAAILIIVLIFIGAGFSLFAMMLRLCEPLCTAGYSRLYFMFGGILAFAFGVFGSVFAAKAQLYDARDNELLLSLPIKPSLLILVRMSGLYLMQLLFCAVVFLPTAAAYMVYNSVSIGFVLSFLLMLLVFPAFVLAVVCLLARLAAALPVRGANKSLLAAAGAIVFLLIYFYVYFQLPVLLQSFIDNAESLFSVGRLLFVFDWFAGALTGDYIDALLFILFSLLLLVIVIRLLSAGFLKNALNRSDGANQATAKIDLSSYRQRKLSAALFSRELTHFINCAPYMINCAPGAPIMLAAAVFALIKQKDVRAMAGILISQNISPIVMAAGILMFILAMNILTAPSISLEGKGIGQLKALPLRATDIVAAKLKLHYVMTLPPLIVGVAAVLIILRPGWLVSLFMTVGVIAYAVFCGLFGIVVNLKLPNFDWVNETVAVKQGLSPMLAIFGQWGFILVSWGIYALTEKFVGDAGAFMCCALLYCVGSVLLAIFIKKRADNIFYNY